MSNKYVGLGFSLKMNSTAIAGIRGMSFSEASGNAVDITVFDDWTTSDRFLRKAGGPVDPGSLSLTLAYDPTDGSHVSLHRLLGTGVASSFTVVYPTTTISQSFNAIVNGLGREIPFGELVTCSVRLDISGSLGLATST